MLFARCVIDTEPAAQRIQRRGRARKFLARNQQGIQRLFERQKPQVRPAQFGIQEFHVKGSVVDHQSRIPDKIQKRLPDGSENRLVAQEIIAQTVHLERFFRHHPLRVDVLVIRPARGHMIEQFDRADFNDAVTLGGFKACGFGVQNDFTHRGSF